MCFIILFNHNRGQWKDNFVRKLQKKQPFYWSKMTKKWQICTAKQNISSKCKRCTEESSWQAVLVPHHHFTGRGEERGQCVIITLSENVNYKELVPFICSVCMQCMSNPGLNYTVLSLQGRSTPVSLHSSVSAEVWGVCVCRICVYVTGLCVSHGY